MDLCDEAQTPRLQFATIQLQEVVLSLFAKLFFCEFVAIWNLTTRSIVGLCDEEKNSKEVLNRKKERDKQV